MAKRKTLVFLLLLVGLCSAVNTEFLSKDSQPFTASQIPPPAPAAPICPNADERCLEMTKMRHIMLLEGEDSNQYEKRNLQFRWVTVMYKTDGIVYYDSADAMLKEPLDIKPDGSTLLHTIPYTSIQLPCLGTICPGDKFLRQAKRKYGSRYSDYPKEVSQFVISPDEKCFGVERISEDNRRVEIHFFCGEVIATVDQWRRDLTNLVRFSLRKFVFSEKAIAGCTTGTQWKGYMTYANAKTLNFVKGYGVLTRFKFPIYKEKGDSGSFLSSLDLDDMLLPMRLGLSNSERYRVSAKEFSACCMEVTRSIPGTETVLCLSLNDAGKEDLDCKWRATTFLEMMNTRALLKQDPVAPDECAIAKSSVEGILEETEGANRFKAMLKCLGRTAADPFNAYIGDQPVEMKPPTSPSELPNAIVHGAVTMNTIASATNNAAANGGANAGMPFFPSTIPQPGVGTPFGSSSMTVPTDTQLGNGAIVRGPFPSPAGADTQNYCGPNCNPQSNQFFPAITRPAPFMNLNPPAGQQAQMPPPMMQPPMMMPPPPMMPAPMMPPMENDDDLRRLRRRVRELMDISKDDGSVPTSTVVLQPAVTTAPPATVLGQSGMPILSAPLYPTDASSTLQAMQLMSQFLGRSQPEPPKTSASISISGLNNLPVAGIPAAAPAML